MSYGNNSSVPSNNGRPVPTHQSGSRVPVPTGVATRPALKTRSSKVRFPSEQLHNPGPHYTSPMAMCASVEGEREMDDEQTAQDFQYPAPVRPASAMDYRSSTHISRQYAGHHEEALPANAMGISTAGPVRPKSAAAGSVPNDKFTSLPARVNRPCDGGRPLTQAYHPDSISPMSVVTDLAPSASMMSDNSYLPATRLPGSSAPVHLAQPIASQPERSYRQEMTPAPQPQEPQLRPPSPAQMVQVVSPRGGLYYRNSLITRGSPIPDTTHEHYDYRSDPPPAPRPYSPPQAGPTAPRHGSFPQDARSAGQDTEHGHAVPHSAAPTYVPRPRTDDDGALSKHNPKEDVAWAVQAYRKGDEYTEEKNDEYTAAHTRANSNGMRQSSVGGTPRMQRRSTMDLEDGTDHAAPRGGIFSQLLRLGGPGGSSMRRRTPSQMSGGMSRSSSVDGGNFPGMAGLGLNRTESVMSFGDEMLDPDDPRVTGIQIKKAKRRMSIGNMFTRNGDEEMGSRFGRRRSSVQRNVADILTRHNFILKLARALIMYGAPSHRLEAQLAATARVLDVDAQFVHLPGILIASFGDHDTRTSETHFVKTGSGLMLGKLRDVHTIYREVVHDEISAGEGSAKLSALFKAAPEYNIYQRLVLAALCSGLVCPLGFGGSFIDAIAAGLLGCTLAFMQMGVAAKNDMFNSIFEIAIAIVISFVARGLSQTGFFCYQAVASSGVVLVLPGYTILCGSLELASKNIVSGVSRMVYAILFSLFLGFGITIGSDLFFLVDPSAGRANAALQAAAGAVTSVDGTFDAMNGTTLWSGSFTFSNGTESAAQSALQAGSVLCSRDPAWAWYRQTVPAIALIGLVPAFSTALSLWNMQPWKSRQLIVMVAISCIGFTCNLFANHYIFNHSDIVSCIGAFIIGILGNLYARITGGTAFTTMCTGVLVLVPSGIAAAGGLAMTYTSASGSDSYSQGLVIGFRMVQVAIGVTVGLLGSGLVVYSFGRKKGSALFAF